MGIKSWLGIGTEEEVEKSAQEILDEVIEEEKAKIKKLLPEGVEVYS